MIHSKVKKNYILNTVYQVMALAFPLLLTPYLSRTIGSEGLGQYSYYFSYASYFVLFSVLGIPNYGNRTIAKAGNKIKDRTRFFLEIYAIQFILSFSVVIVYGVIVHIAFKDNTIAWVFIIYVIAFCFDITWLFTGMEKFKVTVARNFVIKLFTLIFVFIFVKDNTDVFIYAFVYSVGTLIANCVMFPEAVKDLDIKKDISLELKKHVKPILIMFIPFLSVRIYQMMDKVMLGLISQINEVGFYAGSEKILNIPMIFVTSLGTVMIPRISNIVNSMHNSESDSYMHKSILFVMFISSSMCLGIVAVADVFVPVFFGTGFEKCIILLTILMPSCLFMAFANVIRTQYLIPHEMDWQFAVSLLMGAIINLVMNLILIPKHASVGAAFGTLITEIVVCVCQCFWVRKKIPLLKYLFDSLFFIVSGLIMCIIVRNVSIFIKSDYIQLFVKILMGIFIYFFVLVFLYVMHFCYKKVKLFLCHNENNKG